MNIEYIDKEHERIFYEILGKIDCSESDVYRISFAYLIALDSECRKHVNDLYDFGENSIKLEALEKPWLTSSSMRTVTLAINLFNGYCGADTGYIFGYGLYDFYYVQALKLRFPNGAWTE